MFDNHTISLLFLQMSKQTFRMFTLCDHLLFVFCSLHLDVLRCAKNHGLFYLNYPQINEVRKYDHMARFTQFLEHKKMIEEQKERRNKERGNEKNKTERKQIEEKSKECARRKGDKN